MSLQRHLQLGHGTVNLLISFSNTLACSSDINATTVICKFSCHSLTKRELLETWRNLLGGETWKEVTFSKWLVFPAGFPSANCRRRREGQHHQAKWILIDYTGNVPPLSNIIICTQLDWSLAQLVAGLCFYSEDYTGNVTARNILHFHLKPRVLCTSWFDTGF